VRLAGVSVLPQRAPEMPDRGQPLALYRQKKLGHCWPDAAGIFLRPFIDQSSQAHALLVLQRGRTVQLRMGARPSAGLVEGWRPEEDDGIGLGTSGWVGWWGRVPCAWKQSCHPNPTQRMQFSSERGGSFHVLCALDLTRSSNGRQLTCHRLHAPHLPWPVPSAHVGVARVPDARQPTCLLVRAED